MSGKAKCFFCGETNQIVLEEHHIYPKWAEKVTQGLGLPNEIIVLCRNCHKKLHYVLSYYKGIVEKITPEPEEIPVRLAPPRTEEIARRDKIINILGTLIELEKAYEMAHAWAMVPKEVLIEKLQEKGIKPKEANELLDELIREGMVYSPRTGYLKKT